MPAAALDALAPPPNAGPAIEEPRQDSLACQVPPLRGAGLPGASQQAPAADLAEEPELDAQQPPETRCHSAGLRAAVSLASQAPAASQQQQQQQSSDMATELPPAAQHGNAMTAEQPIRNEQPPLYEQQDANTVMSSLGAHSDLPGNGQRAEASSALNDHQVTAASPEEAPAGDAPVGREGRCARSGDKRSKSSADEGSRKPSTSRCNS
jgi:hypothetical protein